MAKVLLVMIEENIFNAQEEQILQFLLFHSAGQDYSLSLKSIIEIRQWQTLTNIPSYPSYIKGVVNLRGQIVPIIDLAVKLGAEPTQIDSKKTVYVVISCGNAKVGLLIDAVSDILSVDRSEIQPDSKATNSNENTGNLTSGFIMSNEKPLMLLDAEAFFEENIMKLIEENSKADAEG